MTRILIIDDQNFTRQALETFLEKETDLKIVGQADNAAKAIEYLDRTQVDIIIADIEMPEIDGITMTRTITRRFPQIKVIIFTSHTDEKNIKDAIEAGAKAYISKNTPVSTILELIHNVNRGYFQLGPGISEIFFNSLIEQQQVTSACLSQLDEKYDRRNESIRQVLFNELHFQLDDELNFQLDNIKTELRQGLNVFQNRVNQQVKIGLEEFAKSNNHSYLLDEIKKQINFHDSEHQVYWRSLFISTKKSVEKLEQQVSLFRYIVILLAVTFFAEHLAFFVLR